MTSAIGALRKEPDSPSNDRSTGIRQSLLGHTCRAPKIPSAEILKWAVERYREERQEPLLKRASETFSQLTLGGYSKLVVDFEAEPVSLNARNADGALVTINGLSTGTEDQLYMALRLAALELHLEQGTPLPFIADDLFINWDDDRAGAGLAALAQLAGKTQVIVLTHHSHLIEVARRATDGRIHLIEL